MGAPEKMVQVEVAAGRTLYTPGVPVEIKDGSKVTFQYTAGEYHGPKAKVMVSQADAKLLRAQGFVYDPDATVIAVGDGPSFAPEDGPTIQPV